MQSRLHEINTPLAIEDVNYLPEEDRDGAIKLFKKIESQMGVWWFSRANILDDNIRTKYLYKRIVSLNEKIKSGEADLGDWELRKRIKAEVKIYILVGFWKVHEKNSDLTLDKFDSLKFKVIQFLNSLIFSEFLRKEIAGLEKCSDLSSVLKCYQGLLKAIKNDYHDNVENLRSDLRYLQHYNLNYDNLDSDTKIARMAIRNRIMFRIFLYFYWVES